MPTIHFSSDRGNKFILPARRELKNHSRTSYIRVRQPVYMSAKVFHLECIVFPHKCNLKKKVDSKPFASKMYYYKTMRISKKVWYTFLHKKYLIIVISKY